MRETILTYISNGLMLSTPLIEKDPAYEALSDSLIDTVEVVALTNSIDIDNMTPLDMKRLLLLVKIELYTRLALASAKEYDFNLEYAGFKKASRFKHYMALVENAQNELTYLDSENYEVYSKEVMISNRDGSRRNYLNGRKATVNLVVTKKGSDLLLDWKINGGSSMLLCCKIYYSTEDFYDEYSKAKIDRKKVIKVENYYGNDNKFKFTNVGEKCFVAVEAIFSNGTSFIGYKEVSLEEE